MKSDFTTGLQAAGASAAAGRPDARPVATTATGWLTEGKAAGERAAASAAGLAALLDVANDANATSVETNKLLHSILRIQIESYEQEANHTLLATRESDLRAGERLTARLTEAEAREGTLGKVAAAIGTGVAGLIGKELLPLVTSRWWLSFAILIACTLLAGWFAFSAYRSYRRSLRRRFAQKAVKEALAEVSDLYSTHSGLKVEIQKSTQRRVSKTAILNPLADKGWDRIGRDGNVADVRKHLSEMAEIDLRRLRDESEYEYRGGEYWYELLQASLRHEVPPFVPLYARSTRGSDVVPVERWRKEAMRLAKAMKWLDRGQRSKFRAFTETLQAVDAYSLEHLKRMLKVCEVQFKYTGPRSDAGRMAEILREKQERSPEAAAAPEGESGADAPNAAAATT